MKIRRFNKKGIMDFKDYLIASKQDSCLEPPWELLEDEMLTEPILPPAEVEKVKFISRYQVADYLNAKLGPLESKMDILRDTGLWAWLSLFYFDIVCPKSEKSSRKVRQLARYISDTSDYKTYYRHLLAGPYLSYRAHRDDPQRTMGILSNPIDKPGEVYEQLAGVSGYLTAPGVISAVTELYYDREKERLKPGASGKNRGSARRLTNFLNQIDLTWDLYSIPTAQLLEILPDEFSKFKS